MHFKHGNIVSIHLNIVCSDWMEFLEDPSSEDQFVEDVYCGLKLDGPDVQ